MFDKLFKPKRQLIKVQNVILPEDLPAVLVPREILLSLAGKHKVFETPTGLTFISSEDIVYRSVRPNGKPKIIQVQRVEINPDSVSCKVNLSVEKLFKLAMNERLIIFETDTEYVIPSGMFFVAKKKRSK